MLVLRYNFSGSQNLVNWAFLRRLKQKNTQYGKNNVEYYDSIPCRLYT